MNRHLKSMIPIVFSTDHNYVMPTGVTICSLLLSAGPDEAYDIFVLEGKNVTEDDRNILRKQVSEISEISSISFINMENHFKGSFEIRDISIASYYRLLIPWLIPQYDKIIYSDVDIIFQTGLSGLYDMELGDYLIGGVESAPDNIWLKHAKYLSKIGLDPTTYTNAGVIVINSKLQRELKLEEKYIQLAQKKFLYQDQDILNIVCKDRIAYFPRKYNLVSRDYDTSATTRDNVVIHYVGDKPWNGFTYGWVEWWNIFNKSIFRDEIRYHQVSSKILSLKNQLKNLRKKVSQKTCMLFLKLK